MTIPIILIMISLVFFIVAGAFRKVSTVALIFLISSIIGAFIYAFL